MVSWTTKLDDGYIHLLVGDWYDDAKVLCGYSGKQAKGDYYIGHHLKMDHKDFCPNCIAKTVETKLKDR